MNRGVAQRGVKLVEILIVLAIIGIITALTIPVYTDYTIRAQVAEGLALANAAKTAVVETNARSGTPPADRSAAGLSPAASDSRVLSLTPYETPDRSVVWRCGLAAVPAGTSPLGTAAGAPATYQAGSLAMLEAGKYLPGSCRPNG